MQLSHWEWNTYLSDIDVAIIGSGIVGLSAAIRLKSQDKNLRVLVIERGVLPSGASTRNAGFACFGSVTELLDDLETHSESEVFDLVEKRWQGLQRLRTLIGDESLDYKAFGSYELFKPSEDVAFGECVARLDFLNKKIARITGEKETFSIADEQIKSFGFEGVSHLIFNHGEGQLDTGRMMSALIEIARRKGVQILNGLNIISLDDSSVGVVLHTENGWSIKAQKVLVATNGFTQKLLPNLSVTPARNQVLITRPITDLPIRGCFHYDKGYIYFRNIGNRILLGGGRNHFREQETTDEFGTTENIREYLTALLHKNILPQKSVEIERWWSGILGVGESKSPIIQQFSPNVAVAVRLGGMGVAVGILVGEAGADLLVS